MYLYAGRKIHLKHSTPIDLNINAWLKAVIQIIHFPFSTCNLFSSIFNLRTRLGKVSKIVNEDATKLIYIGLIQVKKEGWTGFSKGWLGCSGGFPEGEARGKF